MIRLVISIEVAPGHEAEWVRYWQMMKGAVGRIAGFHGAVLLRDRARPTGYLAISEWDGPDQLARARRGLGWLDRDLTTAWTAGPMQIYDEVVDAAEETVSANGGSGQAGGRPEANRLQT